MPNRVLKTEVSVFIIWTPAWTKLVIRCTGNSLLCSVLHSLWWLLLNPDKSSVSFCKVWIWIRRKNGRRMLIVAICKYFHRSMHVIKAALFSYLCRMFNRKICIIVSFFADCIFYSFSPFLPFFPHYKFFLTYCWHCSAQPVTICRCIITSIRLANL